MRSALSKEVQQVGDRHEPSILSREALEQFHKPRIYDASVAETISEMCVDNTDSAFGFQTVLIALTDLLAKPGDISAICARKPEIHKWLRRIVIRQRWINPQEVNLVEGETPHILNVLTAQITPEIR